MNPFAGLLRFFSVALGSARISAAAALGLHAHAQQARPCTARARQQPTQHNQRIGLPTTCSTSAARHCKSTPATHTLGYKRIGLPTHCNQRIATSAMQATRCSHPMRPPQCMAGAAHAGHKSIHHVTAAEQLPLPVMEARLYLDTPEELLTTSNNPIDCSSRIRVPPMIGSLHQALTRCDLGGSGTLSLL